MIREYAERTISTLLLLALVLLAEAVLLMLMSNKNVRSEMVAVSTTMLMLFDLHSIGKRLRPQANLLAQETKSSTVMIVNRYQNIVTGGEYVAQQSLGRLIRRMH